MHAQHVIIFKVVIMLVASEFQDDQMIASCNDWYCEEHDQLVLLQTSFEHLREYHNVSRKQLEGGEQHLTWNMSLELQSANNNKPFTSHGLIRFGNLHRPGGPSTHKHSSIHQVELNYDVNPADLIEIGSDSGLSQFDDRRLQMDGPSLCIDGKLVPQLYLLGAQKAATSSLSFDLIQAGIQSAAGNDKEWHLVQTGVSRSEWLNELPDCSEDNQIVLADFTPENMKFTRPPEGIQVYRGWPDGAPPSRALSETENVRVPAQLSMFYGDEHKNDILFVVMLREPLSRMQSAWYGLRHPPLNEGRTTFSHDVNITLDFWKNSNGTSMLDWMWRSLYAPQIQDYLEYFSPSQLVAIPMKQYTEATNGSQTCVNNILQRLGASRQSVSLEVAENFDSPGEDDNPTNHGEHPPLNDDIDPDIQAAFNHEIQPYNDMLVSLLAKMNDEGSLLMGMDRTQASLEDIRMWLYLYW